MWQRCVVCRGRVRRLRRRLGRAGCGRAAAAELASRPRRTR